MDSGTPTPLRGPWSLSRLTRKRIIRHGHTLYVMRRRSDRTYLLISFSTLTYGPVKGEPMSWSS